MPRDVEGIDGNGRAIYSRVREFQFRWGLLSTAQVWQLQEWWQTIGATGTVTAALPRYAWPTYTFFTYTGVYIQEPVLDVYFTESLTDVTLLVTNIVTEDV
jgi:hypothetical protein